MELVLVLNGGSSTLKASLFEGTSLEPIWEVHEEWHKDFSAKLKQVLTQLPDRPLDAIGHRVVHGGEALIHPTWIDKAVKRKIDQASFLAPLHNPINLAGIEVCEKHFPNLPQFAVFDTAFHTTLPEEAATYPIPYHYREKGIRRYGFHGISYAYCKGRCAAFLNQGLENMKVVICHLGAGASLCALHEGKSIMTTMGMTPLEGVMMATRPGSIDPGVLLHLIREKKGDVAQVDRELNHASGLLGIAGSADMREVINKSDAGDNRATLALNMFCDHLTSGIGALIPLLGGLDLLVFTAGIGEHAPLIRERVGSAFEYIGLEIEGEKNRSPSLKEREISSLTSRVKALVIPTHEEWQIAYEGRRLVNTEGMLN